MADTIIEFSGISKDYRLPESTVRAVRGVSFGIARGSFVAIRGASGSGKSTLLNIIGLLTVPDGGVYRLDGRDVTRCTDAERAHVRNGLIGFVFQQFLLLPRISVLDNVALPAVYRAGRPDHARARECLAAVGLGDYTTRLPNQLSGGQQQRVAIARALMNNPSLILADEPTGNLDSASAESVLDVLAELNRRGTTVIMVTHEPDVARRATRQMEMRDGELAKDSGATAENDRPAAPAAAWSLERRSGRRLLATHTVQAWQSLAAHPFRSLLSALGVMVGTFSVMVTVALITGAGQAVQRNLEALGTNLLIVSPDRDRADFRDGEGRPALDRDDGEAARRVPGVRVVSSAVLGRAEVGVPGGSMAPTPLVGTETAFADLTGNKPSSGRFFTNDEVERRARVALLGATPSRRLFGESSPVGRKVRINGLDFAVIGTVPERGLNPWRDPDDIVVVPITTAMRQLLGRQDVDQLQVEASSRDGVAEAERGLRSLLAKRHPALGKSGEGLRFRNLSRIRRTFEQTSAILSALLASVSVVTLLVGGIGIMNIMLVAVSERTREIGLRKALGARFDDILSQFVVEAVMLSTAGGAAGAASGAALARLVPGLQEHSAVVWAAGIAAFGAAVLTGVAFGLWPAWRAARRDPVESLRYE